MIENVSDISVDQLLGEVQNMRYGGYRFITATSVDNADGTNDVFYHFDKNYEMKHLKMRIPKGTEIPSISRIYFCAMLVENEIKELFGLNIKGMAVDYEGHMLLSDAAPDEPMARQQITVIRKGEDKNA